MNRFDKVFRDKLHHAHDTIPEGLWDKISNELDKQEVPKSKSKAYYIWASMLAITIMLLSWWVSDSNQNSSIQISGENTHKDQTSLIENSQTSVDDAILQGSEVISKVYLGRRDIVKTAYTSNNISIPSYDFPASGETKVFSLDNEVKNHDIVDVESNAPTTISPLFDSEDSPSRRQDNAEILSSNESFAIENKINSIEFVNDHSKVSIHEIQDFSVLGQEVVNENFKKSKVEKACPFLWEGSSKSIDIYASLDMTNNIFTALPQFQAYANTRAETERSVLSYSVGARFGYNLGYRWNAYTGINYSVANQEFEYYDPESSQTRNIRIVDFIYSNGIIVDSVVTTKTEYLPGSMKLKYMNAYRTFDIPILARYTIYANSNISLSALSGLYFNIALRKSGRILDYSSNVPVNIESPNDEGIFQFKSQIGVTAVLGLSVAYHINPSMDLLIEPMARLNTASITTDIHPISQRLNTYSLNVGLRQKF